MAQPLAQKFAILDDDGRLAIDQPRHPAGTLFEQGKADVDGDQGDNDEYRVGHREIIAQQRLLGRLANHHQQNEVEGRQLGQ
ncbi:hypothetical protein D3C76_840150 [compost metagenome]